MAKKLIPSQQDNYSEWYNQLVEKAWLAQNSDVRWCMVIKPYGFAIWENIKGTLDTMFKNTGHQNAYFPLFIPKSYLSKEADHVEGFAKECAVVTHYRLKTSEKGWVEVDPDAKLEEELIVRPTSETIIWKTYKDWINSYRDLPLLINQWANVVRREMRTRMFLRTAEFLWQEGHTAHATSEEAQDEAMQMVHVYNDLLVNWLWIQWIIGVKSKSETFAGAVHTLTIEAMMSDKKALQSCTSHFLGQNFAKAFDVKFTNDQNKEELVWATSWGLSTRIMGGLIMSHSDDDGLVLPPAVAPLHVVIVPIAKTDEDINAIVEYISPMIEWFEASKFIVEGNFEQTELPITYKIDDDLSKSPGWKFAQWELQGVPVRIAVGKRDMENWVLEIARRDTGEKVQLPVAEAAEYITGLLREIQDGLLAKNIAMREENTVSVDTWEEFEEAIQKGFVMAHWDWTEETEEIIKDKTKGTIRCIPLDRVEEDGVCVFSGKPSNGRVIFAKAY